MKKFLICLFFGIIALQMTVHAQEYDKEFYERRIDKCKGKKVVAAVAVIIGCVGVGTGQYFIAQGNQLSKNSTNYNDDYNSTTKYMVGYFLTTIGVVCIGGGGIAWMIFNHKEKEYTKGLNSFSINLAPCPVKAVSLVYKF